MMAKAEREQTKPQGASLSDIPTESQNQVKQLSPNY